MYRVWSDEKSCFVPISTESLEGILSENVKKRREKRLEEIRGAHIKAIQNFAREYKRAPTLTELGKLLGYAPKITTQSLVRYWGYSFEDENNNTTYTEAIDNLYNAAGFEFRRHKGGSIPGQGLSIREPNTLGARLTEKRLELRLDQRGVADRLGLSYSTIIGNELNCHTPKDDTLEKYAIFYGVTTNWILTGD